MMAAHLFRVVSDPGGARKVQLNGKDIGGVKGFTVQVEGEDSKVFLRLDEASPNLNLSGVAAELSEPTREVMEALGWTRAEFIEAARQEAAQAAQEAASAREARDAAEAEVGLLREQGAALEAENAELRRMRTDDAAELHRLRALAESQAAQIEQLKQPAPAGEEV